MVFVSCQSSFGALSKLRFYSCMCSGERMEAQSQVVDRLRTMFRSGVTVPERFRRTQLTNLMSMIKENEEQILNALHKDLAKVQLLSEFCPQLS